MKVFHSFMPGAEFHSGAPPAARVKHPAALVSAGKNRCPPGSSGELPCCKCFYSTVGHIDFWFSMTPEYGPACYVNKSGAVTRTARKPWAKPACRTQRRKVCSSKAFASVARRLPRLAGCGRQSAALLNQTLHPAQGEEKMTTTRCARVVFHVWAPTQRNALSLLGNLVGHCGSARSRLGTVCQRELPPGRFRSIRGQIPWQGSSSRTRVHCMGGHTTLLCTRVTMLMFLLLSFCTWLHLSSGCSPHSARNLIPSLGERVCFSTRDRHSGVQAT